MKTGTSLPHLEHRYRKTIVATKVTIFMQEPASRARSSLHSQTGACRFITTRRMTWALSQDGFPLQILHLTKPPATLFLTRPVPLS